MKKLFVILFTICFTFQYIQSQTFVQTIRGRVLDADSDAPLISATVQVAGSELELATITDDNGFYTLKNVTVGRQTLIYSYIGYQQHVASEVMVGSAKEVILNVKLKEKIESIEEVNVVFKRKKDKPVNDMAMVSSRQFSVEETGRYAASLDDPARMATSFAGVAITGDDIRNEIVIRGNSPRGMLWQIEGVPVPNPNHFSEEGSSGGAVSILSNNVLDNSDFLTGAWPAEFSDAISGVFDIKLRNGNNQKREYAFQAGLLGVDFAAEGPLSKKNKASYLINYRYSTLSIFDKIGVHILDERDGIPTFQDLTFKLNLPTQKLGTFTIWGLGGISSQHTETIIAFDTTYNNVAFNYMEYGGFEADKSTGAFGVSHKFFPDNKSYIKTSIVLSGSNLVDEHDGRLDPGIAISRIEPEFSEKIKKGQELASIHYQRKFTPAFTLRTGVQFRSMKHNVFVEEYNYDSLRFFTELDKKGGMYYLQGYVQSTYSFNKNLSLYSGLSYSRLMLNNEFSIEPRLALKYKFNGSQSLTFGYGKHSQLQSEALYLVEVENEEGVKSAANEGLGFNKATHYVLTYDNMLAKNLLLKLDFYYQTLSNIPIPKDTLGNEYLKTYSSINDVDWFTFVPLENKGTGRNYGVELTLERFFTRGWYAMVNGSLYESKYTAKDEVERNSRFNGNYIFNAVGGKEFTFRNKVLGTNIKYSHLGGRYFTPVLDEITVTDEQGNPVLDVVSGQPIVYAPSDFQHNFSKKLDDYKRIDLSVFYRVNMKNTAHIFTVEIQNVLNRQNIGGLNGYNVRTHDYNYWYQTSLIPIFKYRLEF